MLEEIIKNKVDIFDYVKRLNSCVSKNTPAKTTLKIKSILRLVAWGGRVGGKFATNTGKGRLPVRNLLQIDPKIHPVDK